MPHQSTLGPGHRDNATLEFTPTALGLHHVFAAFDPVGGIHQFDLYAVRDRSSEAPRHLLGPRCRGLERTTRGAWVCDSQVLREGAAAQQLPNGKLAVAGDVVWVVETQRIHRFVDDGQTLAATASLSHSQGTAGFLLASESELVVLHGGALQRITFDGTQLTSTGVTPWAPEGSFPLGTNAPQGILLRTGEALAVVSRPPSSAGPLRLQACGYQLDGGRFTRTAEPCQLLDGDVVGFEPSVLWLAERDSSTNTAENLLRLEWTGTRLVPRASLWVGPLSLVLVELDRPAIVPVFATVVQWPASSILTAIPVYVPEEGRLRLEHLEGEFAFPLASPTLFWGEPFRGGATARTQVRLRPSTP